MKKSYLALGLVAAVAMSSCSNDEPIPGGNQPGVAEGYVPVELSLTNSAADVNVGTRGTGTVGGMTTETNTWKYEDIYVLMTSSDIRCLEASKTMTDEQKATADLWGFTSAMGVGPFLQEQFNGKFWARPSKDESTGKYGLNYFIDQNEWWDGAPIWKYYPMYGESQFFAYYVDDACLEGERSQMTSPFEAVGEEGSTHLQGGSIFNPFPKIKHNVEAKTMSVDFKIDGSQDLMLGKAEGSFSAQTARKGVEGVPSITMNHMLSRLTFNIKKGAESANMVTVKKVSVYSKSEGDMVVAYKDEPKDEEGKLLPLITWTNLAEVTNPAKFDLKQYPAALPKTGSGNVCLDENGDVIKVQAIAYQEISNPETGETTYEPYEDLQDVALYWYKVQGVKTFTIDNGKPGSKAQPIEFIVRDESNNIISGNVDEASYAAAMLKVEAAKPALPIASLQTGKDKLVDFEPVVLREFFANQTEGAIGEAMFVAPGETSYKMELLLQMLVRYENEEFDGVEDDYQSTELTEDVTLPLTLTMPAGKTFEAGKSYQVNVTIYGMEKILLEVVPTAWVDGGHFDVGGDKDGEGNYSENGTHDDSEYENDPSTGDETEDDENDPENDPSNDDNTEQWPVDPEGNGEGA